LPRVSSDEDSISKFVAGLAPMFHCFAGILESYHELTRSSHFYTLQSLTLLIYPVLQFFLLPICLNINHNQSLSD
jgi:hypothetical protein